MIPPEMPACRTIRQAVFDDDTNGKFHDFIGIAGVGSGDVRGVDLKIFIALAAIVNGILEMNIDGPSGCTVAEMMKFPFTYFMPCRWSGAERTRTFFRCSRALFCFRRREIVWIDDPFGRVVAIFTGARHGMILLEFRGQSGNMPDFPI